jgi:hypothetical protein
MAAGPSILELMWKELDAVIDQIQQTSNGQEMRQLRAEATGIAKCVAIILNPYKPDVNAVRQFAAARLEERS